VQDRILLGKDRVVFYEAVQEFRVAETADGTLIGCGALHVMWEATG
jgi:amino-acid N-acetyltransferase